MKNKWWKIGVTGILLIGMIAGVLFLSNSNRYQTEGEAHLKGLSASARVIRDEKGMPYIYAENLLDLLKE
mgnify:CR=1 FL=1